MQRVRVSVVGKASKSRTRREGTEPAAKSHGQQHGAQPPWLLSAATAGADTCCPLIFQEYHSMGSQTTLACRGEGALPLQLPESPSPPALYAAAYITDDENSNITV